jgi:hypothetical protein
MPGPVDVVEVGDRLRFPLAGEEVKRKTTAPFHLGDETRALHGEE